MKNAQATGETYSPQKRTSSTSKDENSVLFSIFLGHFCPPGSGSGSAICMRIRIQQLKLMRIHADPDPDTDPKPWKKEVDAYWKIFFYSDQRIPNRSKLPDRNILTLKPQNRLFLFNTSVL
jgi:hypothetical protein